MQSSFALSTILAEIYGYRAASAVAKHAACHDISISQVAVVCGVLSEQDASRLFIDVCAFADAGAGRLQKKPRYSLRDAPWPSTDMLM